MNLLLFDYAILALYDIKITKSFMVTFRMLNLMKPLQQKTRNPPSIVRYQQTIEKVTTVLQIHLEMMCTTKNIIMETLNI